MKVSNKTVHHLIEMDYGNPLTKSEICLAQFKTYVLWAKGIPKKHSSYKRVLELARHSYELYKCYKNEDLIVAFDNLMLYNDLEVTEIKEIA